MQHDKKVYGENLANKGCCGLDYILPQNKRLWPSRALSYCHSNKGHNFEGAIPTQNREIDITGSYLFRARC